MKKILIVAKDALLEKSLALICKSMKLKVATAAHEHALSVFLSEEPNIVLVCDYQENGGENFKGKETFKDVKNSSTSEIILRCGFSKYDHSDYLQLPFKLEEFKKKIKGK